jgi:hypothetical protein
MVHLKVVEQVAKKVIQMRTARAIGLACLVLCTDTGSAGGRSPMKLGLQEIKQKADDVGAVTVRRFTLVIVGNGITADLVPTDFKTFKGPNGDLLRETWITFDSKARATKELRSLLKESFKTIRRTPELVEGKQVGERVLVLRHDRRTDATEAILAWTTDAKYREVQSPSLEDVVMFEKLLEPTRSPKVDRP